MLECEHPTAPLTESSNTFTRWNNKDIQEILTNENRKEDALDSLREYMIQLGILAHQNLQTSDMRKGLSLLGFTTYSEGLGGLNNQVEVDLQGGGYPFMKLQYRLSPIDPTKNKHGLDNQNYTSSWSSVEFDNYPGSSFMLQAPTKIYDNNLFYIRNNTTQQTEYGKEPAIISKLPLDEHLLETLSDGVSLLVAATQSPLIYHGTISELTRKSLHNSPANMHDIINERLDRLEENFSTITISEERR